MKKTYFLTGALGGLGRLVEEAFPKDEELILGARKISSYKGNRQIREFDYKDEAKMVDALKGVDTLCFISSNSDAKSRLSEQENVVNAAKKAGVLRVIYLSFITARLKSSNFDVTKSHQETENLLKVSGLKHVLLRPSWYMDNLLFALEEAKDKGYFTDASGSGRLSLIAKEDVAKAMVKACFDEEKSGVYTLTSSETFSLPEVAKLFTKLLQKEIFYKVLSLDDMDLVYKKQGLPEFLANSLAKNSRGIDMGEYELTSKDYELLVGDKALGLEEFFVKALGTK